MPAVFLSIGSNLGDRLSNLRLAVSQLEGAIVPGSLTASSLYETEPVDCPEGSPSFLNAVIAFETDLEAEHLLDLTQSIEARLGRPSERAVNDPRPVDLDLLLYGEAKIKTERLTVPHPRMEERAFVLLPLAELRQEYALLLDRVDQDGVTKLTQSLLTD